MERSLLEIEFDLDRDVNYGGTFGLPDCRLQKGCGRLTSCGGKREQAF